LPFNGASLDRSRLAAGSGDRAARRLGRFLRLGAEAAHAYYWRQCAHDGIMTLRLAASLNFEVEV
jgi:hypothetical protein